MPGSSAASDVARPTSHRTHPATRREVIAYLESSDAPRAWDNSAIVVGVVFAAGARRVCPCRVLVTLGLGVHRGAPLKRKPGCQPLRRRPSWAECRLRLVRERTQPRLSHEQ